MFGSTMQGQTIESPHTSSFTRIFCLCKCDWNLQRTTHTNSSFTPIKQNKTLCKVTSGLLQTIAVYCRKVTLNDFLVLCGTFNGYTTFQLYSILGSSHPHLRACHLVTSFLGELITSVQWVNSSAGSCRSPPITVFPTTWSLKWMCLLWCMAVICTRSLLQYSRSITKVKYS